MRILILSSGGDAPGMNRFIYQIYKRFRKQVFACKYGFKGLITGEIYPLEQFIKPYFKNMAGSMIKSARCPEFATEAGFKKGLKNAEKYDVVIVMGGNGSYKGAEELSKAGVRAIFVPCTIDNDVNISEYSIGFHTAVTACCEYVYNTMPSMEAFNRACIFEVMGRKHDAIAANTASIVQADYAILSEENLDEKKIGRIIKTNVKNEKSTLIILREKITDGEMLEKKLSSYGDTKFCRVGHLQRGRKPSKLEIKMAKSFAQKCIKVLSSKRDSAAVVYNGGKFEIISFSK